MSSHGSDHGSDFGSDSGGPDFKGADRDVPGREQAGREQAGSAPREPLHQPPDPRDLAAVPPMTSTCANVRGQLRDFVDGDLPAAQRVAVEEHAHACRTCAVAMSRAEHEVLLLRRAYAAVARDEGAVGPRAGFATRVVDRLVMDETSLLSRDALSAAALRPAATAVATTPTPRALGWAPRRASLARCLLAAVAVLVIMAVAAVFIDAGDGRPENTARLVITSADETFGDFGVRLGLGDGLGEDQTLWVGRNGEASVDLHDASPKSQPVAHLQVSNRGQVRLQGGEPLLVNGDLEVRSARAVTIPVADGSRIELGAGDYLIAVEHVEGELGRRQGGLDEAPGSLRVAVEVLRGDAAVVVRAQQESALVAVGRIGVYRGDSSVVVTAGPSFGSDFGDLPVRGTPPSVTAARQARLRGNVVERSGAAAVGADVLLSFASGGQVRSAGATVGATGAFELVTGPVGGSSACDSGFAIVQVVPSAMRSELGLTVPDAVRLNYADGDARLATSPVLDVSSPLEGVVVDDSGSLRSGVRIVPCVVDELFRAVLVWAEGQVVSKGDGSFRLTRLPAALPSHQHLSMLLVHADLEPAMVPVPSPGSQAARSFQARFLAPRLRTVQIEGLPASAALLLQEDVPGMPPGMGVIRRPVTSDAQGRVANVRVGSGALWLRSPSLSHLMVRSLVVVQQSPVAIYRPLGGAPQPYDDMFANTPSQLGSELFHASSYRFQRFNTQSSLAVQRGQRLYAIDAASQRTLAGAQVFAVGAAAPRNRATARFLGFTSGNGMLTAELLANESGLVVIGPDGSTGFSSGLHQGDDVTVAMRTGGRVLLGPGLRPAPNSGRDVVTIRFESADLGPAGQQVVAVRFASSALGWECSDVPPGSYRAIVDGQARSIEVPSSGLFVLQ